MYIYEGTMKSIRCTSRKEIKPLNNHNMKKLIALLVLFIPVLGALAQREYLPTEGDLQDFYKTKTYIVMQDNPMSAYNFEITDAIKQYWDITDYEFLTFKDFQPKSEDSTASFLYTAEVTFEKDKSMTKYIFLCLSLGGKRKALDDLRDIVNIPLAYQGVDDDTYAYKLGTLVNFMQKHIRMITDRPELISQNVFKEYNDNMADIHGKTLYLVKDELEKDINSLPKIKEIYPYDVKLVTRDDIRDAILNKDENVVFLHKVGPQGKKLHARVYKILIGAGDSNFYYFDYHTASPKKPDAFLKSDLKALAKAKD